MIWTGRLARIFMCVSPFLRSVSEAARTAAKRLVLLVAQRLDRMQARGPHRRIEAEDDADRDGHADGDRDRPRGDEDRDLRRGGDLVHDDSQAPAEEDPRAAAVAGEADRLDAELREDVATARPARLP